MSIILVDICSNLEIGHVSSIKIEINKYHQNFESMTLQQVNMQSKSFEVISMPLNQLTCHELGLKCLLNGYE
jgi:hypothetical protein